MSRLGDWQSREPLSAEQPALPDARLRARWRSTALLAGAVIVAILAAYAETAGTIVATWWRSQTFAHGFLILPISGWLIWIRREALLRMAPAPAPAAALVVAGAGFAWLLAHWADVLVIQQLVLVAMIPLTAIALLGLRVARAITFPLAYLIFAVPMGAFLVAPMQDVTAAFTVKALQLSGIPVLWEGRYITLPTSRWEVAEACSGVRYIIASVAVGALYAYLTYRSRWKRLAFIAVAALVPIVANGIRAYSIVLMGHVFGSEVARGVDHIIWGWIFFGMVILLMFWVGSFWRDPDEEIGTGGALRRPADGTPVGGDRRAAATLVMTAIAVLAAATVWPAVALTGAQDGSDGAPIAAALPAAHGDWTGPLPSATPWEPMFPSGDVRAHRQYRRGDQSVDVLLIGYRQQRQGEEMISTQNHVFDGRFWRRRGESQEAVLLPGGRTLEVHETRMDSPLDSRVVWSWYVVGRHPTASPVEGKIREAWSRLTGEAELSYVVMLATPYDFRPEEGREVLRAFIRDLPRIAVPGALLQREGSRP